LFFALAVLAAAAAAYPLYRAYSLSAERQKALDLAENGPPAEALPALLKCLERDPDNPDLLRATVDAMIRAGTAVSDVEPYADRWCAAEPNDPVAFRVRMDLLRRLARYPEALASGERALELDPTDIATRADVASLNLAVGRYAEAAEGYRRLLAFGDDTGEITLGLARAEWEQGNAAEAARLTDGLLARRPEHPGALIFRGLIHQRAGEPEQVVAVLRRVRDPSPESRKIVLYNLGLALERLGRSEEAKKAFAELATVQNATRFATDAEQRPDDVALQVRSAEAWRLAGDPEAGRQTLEALLSRTGPNKQALAALAACYDALGRPDLAARAKADAEHAP
jgi:tetratricopeptide (TPR) repeat protein